MTTSGKYGINGVMIFVLESPTRYAACVRSGEMPSVISIGTKIGASKPHLPLAEPTKMLTNAVSSTMPTISSAVGRPIAFRTSAPEMAIRVPRFDTEKAMTNCAMKNMMTM